MRMLLGAGGSTRRRQRPRRRWWGTLAFALLLASPAIATAPAGRYVVTTATVTDTRTHLVWQRAVPAMTYAWADAKTYCSGAGAALGGSGWRLPTVKELQTLVDDSRVDPAIDAAIFPDTPSDAFWSSSELVDSPSYAWNVYFYTGATYTYDAAAPFHVRCVR